ncbi:hypothetical protein [Herbaspirillum rhizosphaerae]|uniref:hypothetical protein n=1 Tax=Herbaspirillum rhizosphaerae TaxID=346179 RepID=UPI00142F3698|nr:hypothetical protein [Herbaspirillum rhizosphaerae]
MTMRISSQISLQISSQYRHAATATSVTIKERDLRRRWSWPETYIPLDDRAGVLEPAFAIRCRCRRVVVGENDVR